MGFAQVPGMAVDTLDTEVSAPFLTRPPTRAGDCRPTSPGCKSGLCAQKPSSPGEERIPHHRGPRGPLSPLGSSLLSPRNIKHL